MGHLPYFSVEENAFFESKVCLDLKRRFVVSDIYYWHLREEGQEAVVGDNSLIAHFSHDNLSYNVPLIDEKSSKAVYDNDSPCGHIYHICNIGPEWYWEQNVKEKISAGTYEKEL